ncbi:MAG: DUF805 domain-containing protein, partial [Pirellula sp.]
MDIGYEGGSSDSGWLANLFSNYQWPWILLLLCLALFPPLIFVLIAGMGILAGLAFVSDRGGWRGVFVKFCNAVTEFSESVLKPHRSAPTLPSFLQEAAADSVEQHAPSDSGLSMPFKFECENCGQRMSATEDMVGMETNCPNCEAPIVVPADPHHKESTNPLPPPPSPVRESSIIPEGAAAAEHAETAKPRVNTISLGRLLLSFQGRIGRGLFWASWAAMALLTVLVMAVSGLVLEKNEAAGGLLMTLWFIPLVWIMLAIQVKRWHDLNKSGWMVLIGLIPCLGVISLVFVGFVKGTTGPNDYGDDPLQAGTGTDPIQSTLSTSAIPELPSTSCPPGASTPKQTMPT